MLFKKEEKSSNDFWQEYEEKTGEKVLARGMGKYSSGWNEFDEKKWKDIWGLVITTSGGFRFHHFPQNSWFDSLTRFADKGQPKEKTIFIPQEKIISSELIVETKWWKKIFSSSSPRFVVKYVDDSGQERLLIFESSFYTEHQ